MDELELETTINIQRLGYEFIDKPIIVGGLAMEYYGLRKFLEVMHIISLRHFLLKVTILMGYLFQTSSKKEGLDLYNPE